MGRFDIIDANSLSPEECLKEVLTNAIIAARDVVHFKEDPKMYSKSLPIDEVERVKSFPFGIMAALFAIWQFWGQRWIAYEVSDDWPSDLDLRTRLQIRNEVKNGSGQLLRTFESAYTEKCDNILNEIEIMFDLDK